MIVDAQMVHEPPRRNHLANAPPSDAVARHR